MNLMSELLSSYLKNPSLTLEEIVEASILVVKATTRAAGAIVEERATIIKRK